jgi:NAD(P)-dependent dehydrogenase (short-subunit alcohol dehydrogenase family)
MGAVVYEIKLLTIIQSSIFLLYMKQTPQPESAPYAASKRGTQMLTKTIALELADKGIRVNV